MAISLALLVAALSTPGPGLQSWTHATALAKSVKHKHHKKHGFVRKGVSYTPYVPPGAGTTSTPGTIAGELVSCSNLARSDRWPAGRRLALWQAFVGRGPDAQVLSLGVVCRRVQGFVDRLTSTPATDGHHELPRSWACDFGAPRSICTHRLPDATVDLSVVFEPPGRLAAGRATGRVVAAGSDKPTPGATERLTISGEDVGGGTRFLVVGKQPCGRSAAATEAAMEEAGSPPFADDRLPWHGFSSNYLLPFDVYLRPARGGTYHACLFWQEHDTDAEALAVVQTTFTWFAPAKAHA